MKRTTVVASLLYACLVLGWTAGAEAGQKSQLLANATVKSISGSSLSVTAADGKEMTFILDGKTNVVGKGVGTKTAAKGKGGKAAITDLLSEGDKVSVTYREMGSTLHAAKIELARGAKK